MGRQAGTPTDDHGDQRGYPPLPLLLDDEVFEQQPDQVGLTARYLDAALRVIRRPDDRPFFLYLAHMYVHLPIYVQARFAAASRNGAYGAAVETIDWVTAVILHELRSRGLDESTIVVFTSDNGSRASRAAATRHFAAPRARRGRAGCACRASCAGPATSRAGRTSDELATSLDLFPTLATLCGAEVPTDRTVDGVDISALLLDDQAPSPREAFWYYWMNDLHAVRAGPLEAARRPRRCGGQRAVRRRRRPRRVPRPGGRATRRCGATRGRRRRARASLGDARLGISGADVRPIGRVTDAVPLTTYDPAHPYYAAEYDLPGSRLTT